MANTIIIGVIITVCSNNWISIWIGLEVSLLSFTPFLLNKNKTRSESIIKYFIIQSVASTIFLFRVIYILIGVSILNEIIITVAILIKLGSAPFHNWVIIIIETINYWVILTFLTLIKIPSLVIIHHINRMFLLVPILLGIMTGSVSCINQSSVRKTLGFSSIYNLRLILSSINKLNVTLIFLLIYSFILIIFTLIIKLNKINFINQIIFNEFNPWLKINLWINILSLGGFPPTIGFISKLIIIQTINSNREILLMLIFVLTSILVLIFYTRLVFLSMLNSSTFNKWIFFNKTKSLIFIISINFTLPVILMRLTRVF